MRAKRKKKASPAKKSEAIEPEVLLDDEALDEAKAKLDAGSLSRILGVPIEELRGKLAANSQEREATKRARIGLRRAAVARLFLSKRRPTEIASILGVSKPTITRDLQALEKEWHRERISSVVEFIRKELRELDEMERDATARFYSVEEEIDRVRWFRTRLDLKERRWRLLGLTSGVELEILIREELRAEVDEGGDAANLAEIDDAATLVRLYRRKSGATG